MFGYFLEQYGLQPETCVFVDDTAENVEAAQDLGFRGIVFHSYDKLTAELKSLGIETI